MLKITDKLSVMPLFVVSDNNFKRQYELGIWWAMYGDEQGNGLYEDHYVIDNIERGFVRGWYKNPHDPEFQHLGFYLGMLHGGQLVAKTPELAIITDPDFGRGYYSPTERGQVFSDQSFCELIYNLALQPYSRAVLAYELGEWIGNLKVRILSQVVQEAVTSSR